MAVVVVNEEFCEHLVYAFCYDTDLCLPGATRYRLEHILYSLKDGPQKNVVQEFIAKKLLHSYLPELMTTKDFLLLDFAFSQLCLLFFLNNPDVKNCFFCNFTMEEKQLACEDAYVTLLLQNCVM